MSSNENSENTKSKWDWKLVLGWFVGTSMAILLSAGMLCINSITPPDFAYSVDYWNGGKVSPINQQGIVFTSPFVRVYKIDTLARQECLKVGDTSSNDGLSSRISNCKLLKFNPAGLNELIARHGASTDGNISKILALHAFDTSTTLPPFVEIVPQKSMEERQ